MNKFIKLGLGIALALLLSNSLTAVNDAYGLVETPQSFRALSKMSPQEVVAHSPMSGEQLAAVKGMAGICISCLNETVDRLVQTLAQRGQFSFEDAETTMTTSNQFVIGAGPVTQTNQAIVNQTIRNQTFSPSREQLSIVRVQQSQTQGTEIQNNQQTSNLAQEITTSTQETINQSVNLPQLQNALQSGQSSITSGESLALEIITSTQEIINQAIINGTVNATTINQQINQQFTNIPGGRLLR